MSEYVVEEPSDGSASWRVHELIVRCRDCGKSIGGVQCMRHKSSGWSGNTWVEEYEQVYPDGFCAWGERRGA